MYPLIAASSLLLLTCQRIPLTAPWRETNPFVKVVHASRSELRAITPPGQYAPETVGGCPVVKPMSTRNPPLLLDSRLPVGPKYAGFTWNTNRRSREVTHFPTPGSHGVRRQSRSQLAQDVSLHVIMMQGLSARQARSGGDNSPATGCSIHVRRRGHITVEQFDAGQRIHYGHLKNASQPHHPNSVW